MQKHGLLLTWTMVLTLTADVDADAELTADEALAWLLTGAFDWIWRLTGGASMSVSEEKEKAPRASRGGKSNSCLLAGHGNGCANHLSMLCYVTGYNAKTTYA